MGEFELKASYVAGLIDADGCLGINKVDEGRHSPCLSFVNTSPDLIDLVHKFLGGHIHKKKKISPNHADVYEIQIRDSIQLIEAINKIESFLVYKKIKAGVVKKYAMSIIDNRNKNRTKKVLQERIDIITEWNSIK